MKAHPSDGARKKPEPQAQRGPLFTTARVEHFLADLERHLKFPGMMTPTTLKSDMLLVSRAIRQVVLLNLTVPWEDGM